VKILLTGATGFLGAHVARRLERESVEVALLVRPQSNLWRLQPLPKHARLIHGDLQQLPASEINSFAPDTIIHAAWQGVTNQHRNDPSQISANLDPILRLVELAQVAGARHFVGLGSQAEYGPLNKKISENDATNPTTLYGATKLAACHLTRQLCAQSNIRWAWLRVFSTYGPMEDLTWMIPYLIRSLLRGERPALTACEQLWDFLYGPDAADAICSVALTPGATGIFNLGSGYAEPLRKIVETLRDAIDPKLPLGIGEVPYRPDQVMHLEADITRLTQATGWKPITSLDEGLKKTVAWHKSQL
jgi:UDP-glucose 4-epimerase